RWCLGLQRRDKEKVLHGRETGVIKRLPHGEFTEVHAPLTAAELHRLTSHEQPRPLELPAAVDENGVAHPAGALTRTRARLSRGLYGEGARIAKPTAEEYREITDGQGHGH
ncbi:ubiquinol-cytochrome c reductase cytochrome b subunit, partial [Kitasatospora sp. NPDC087315]